MRVSVLTLFPELFPGALGTSLLGRALDKGLWSLDVVNIRDFATDKHQTVDDTPFGGGPGMVMRPDVVSEALASVAQPGKTRVINMSPRGAVFSQKMAEDWAQETRPFVFVCGRYEGIDQRVLDVWDVEDVSLGDFILTGGDAAALTMIETAVRLLPGVVGAEASLDDESFSEGLLEYSQYTRPREWQGHTVPDILLSGHHGDIKTWRHRESERITEQRRPDLWQSYQK